MKAVVVVPPVEDFYFTPHRFSALGAKIVVRLLEKAGWQAVFFNFPLTGKKGAVLPLPPEFHYLKPCLIPGETGKASFFTGLRCFGPAPEECAGILAAEQPALIFISCYAFCYALTALGLAAAAKQKMPAVPVVAGGAGVTAYPEFFIRHNSIDYLLVGEAEACLPAFLAAYNNGLRGIETVPNLYRKTGGTIIKPAVIRKAQVHELFFTWNKTCERAGEIFISTALSRGCGKKCRFCVNHDDDQFRLLPRESLLPGLDTLAGELAGTHKRIRLNFEDDNLLFAPAYWLALLDECSKRLPGAVFYAENGIDYTLLTDPLAARLICKGLKQFNLSVGSIDPLLLAQEQRTGAWERYRSVIDLLAKQAVPSITYFICGFKNETREKIVSTLTLLAEQNTRIGISLFYPVPGLPDFRDYSLFDALSPRLTLGAAAYPWNHSLSTASLITAFRLSRMINLIKDQGKTPEDEKLLEQVFKEKALFTFIKRGRKREMVQVPGMDSAMVAGVLAGIKSNRG